MLSKALTAAALASSVAAFVVPSDAIVQDIQDLAAPNEQPNAAMHKGPPPPPHGDVSLVQLDCPGCALALPRDDKDAAAPFTVLTMDVPNHLDLFFSLDHTPSGDRFLVNGYELFPEVNASSVLSAPQVPNHRPHGKGKHHEGKHHGKIMGKHHDGDDFPSEHEHDGHHEEEHENDENEELKKKDVKTSEAENNKAPPHPPHPPHPIFPEAPLGYTMEVHVDDNKESGPDVITLSMRIVEVNDFFVEGISEITFHILRNAEGRLRVSPALIGDHQQGHVLPEPHGEHPHGEHPHGPPPHGPPPHGEHPHGPPPHSKELEMKEFADRLAQCTDFMCRWKVMMGADAAPHGCGGAKHHGEDKFAAKHHGHGHSHDHPEGEGHMPFRHAHEHRWLEMFKTFVAHIVVPVLIGIVAGVGVSLLGMAVGTLLVYTWRAFHPYNGPGHEASHRPAVDYVSCEAGVAEEKAGLMAMAEHEEEALPAYSDKTEEA